MALVISQEHDLLRDAAKGFLAEHAPVGALRTLRDSDDPFGYDPALWQRMTGMGWAGILVPSSGRPGGFFSSHRSTRAAATIPAASSCPQSHPETVLCLMVKRHLCSMGTWRIR